MISDYLKNKLRQAGFTPIGMSQVERFLNRHEGSYIQWIFEDSCIIRIEGKDTFEGNGYREIMSSGNHYDCTLVWKKEDL